MHPAAEKAKAEVRKILVVAVFFAIGFCIIILHNRLLVEGSQIQIASYARALVGGLIAAKAPQRSTSISTLAISRLRLTKIRSLID